MSRTRSRPELPARLLRAHQVADVRRVERPAEDPDPRHVAARPPVQRTWPSPVTTYLNVQSSRSPIGPRACSFWVELPISAPIPNSPPSVNRVDAFDVDAGGVDAGSKARADAASAVTIASLVARPVRVDVRDRLVDVESTTPTASVSARNSVSQSSSVASCSSRQVCPGERPGAPVDAQLDAGRPGVPSSAEGRNSTGRVGVDEQRLGRVAHARPLGLGVQR